MVIAPHVSLAGLDYEIEAKSMVISSLPTQDFNI